MAAGVGGRGWECVTPPAPQDTMLAVKYATSLGKLMKFSYKQWFDFQGVGLGKLYLNAKESRKGYLKRFRGAKFQGGLPS